MLLSCSSMACSCFLASPSGILVFLVDLTWRPGLGGELGIAMLGRGFEGSMGDAAWPSDVTLLTDL